MIDQFIELIEVIIEQRSIKSDRFLDAGDFFQRQKATPNSAVLSYIIISLIELTTNHSARNSYDILFYSKFRGFCKNDFH